MKPYHNVQTNDYHRQLKQCYYLINDCWERLSYNHNYNKAFRN